MAVSIPSKWGFCDDVLIVPMKIGEAYFTAVMDAPDEWSSELIVSGFKRVNEGWIKRGLANEYELAYLSDDVDIRDTDVSFFENYFNQVEPDAGIAIPEEIKQAIEWLSLRGRKALEFEFSIAYPNVSDAGLSGYLEDALSGVTSPETGIIYDLSVERVRSVSDGELSASVIEFAKEKNISLVVQADDVLGQKGSVVLSRGDLVSWFDDSDTERHGRVSRPLRVGDDGCWLHSLPVAWVGGYPMPSEVWVTAKALGITVSPMAADSSAGDLGYEEAVGFLDNLDRSDVEALADRIFKAIPPSRENDFIRQNAWIANGKLWGDVSLTGVNIYGAGVVELDDLLCPIGDEDRALIGQISSALDIVNHREYGSDSVDGTTLCFMGVTGAGGAALFQYSLTGLFPVDEPLMKVSPGIAASLREITGADGGSLLANYKRYQSKLNNRLAIARSYAPTVDDANGVQTTVISTESIDVGVKLIVGDTDDFRDRVIGLGSKIDGLTDNVAYRLSFIREQSLTSSLHRVTPDGLSDAVKDFSLGNFYPEQDEDSHSPVPPNQAMSVWLHNVSKPSYVGDAFNHLVAKSWDANLVSHYFAIAGPLINSGNDQIDAIFDKYKIGRLYDRDGYFSSGLEKTDCKFVTDISSLSADVSRLDDLLNELGYFDDENQFFSQSSFDLWKTYSDSVVDSIRMSSVANKIASYDRKSLESIIDGEISKHWGAFLAKTLGDEGRGRVRLAVLNSVIEKASNSTLYNGTSRLDAVIYRISSSRRNVSWRSAGVDTQSIGDKGDWLKEPRSAMIDRAYSEGFPKRGGPKLVIDLLSIVDPELSGRLYNLGSDPSVNQLPQAKPESIGTGYQDTGVVTGLSIKELRAMSLDNLIATTNGMSSTQREKYIEKKLYFPRPTMASLKDSGCSPLVAAFLDQAWVLMPTKPYSLLTADVDFYGQLTGAAKIATDRFLERKDILNASGDSFNAVAEAYDDEMKTSGVHDLINGCDWHKRNFYTRGAVFKDINIFGAYGFRQGYNSSASSFVAELFERNFRIRKGGQNLRSSDMTWSNLLPKKAKSQSSAVSKKDSAPDVRSGEDYRKGKVIESEDFIKTFGFSGVEFGNWTNQAERESHINLSYDSMLDFSKLIECEPMALSLGGRLGLCFGSRGRGGKNPASAHYEPVNMAINLTRKSGRGALAHEYFHAIAGHYGELESGIKGSDLSNKMGNVLFNANAKFASTPLLRESMQKSFFDLMKAIIYKPSKGHEGSLDLENYTENSALYVASMKEDGNGDAYWSQPHEMFARSMEVWVGLELAKREVRNDYLVGSSKLKFESELYPDAEHMSRISHFADKWVGALRTELKQVQHPYLGEIEMPIFHSKNKAFQPINQYELERFARKEMNALFGKIQPEIDFTDDAHSVSAGTYDLVKNLMTLNLKSADRNTFYHEAWHACHSTMLNTDDKSFLADAFNHETLRLAVTTVMEDEGYAAGAVEDALSNPLEMQAYAFELWAAGKLDLGAERTESVFDGVKDVADSAADISSAFTLKGVESIFERFYGGEMALESDMADAVEDHGFEAYADDDFEHGHVVYMPELRSSGGMGM